MDGIVAGTPASVVSTPKHKRKSAAAIAAEQLAFSLVSKTVTGRNLTCGINGAISMNDSTTVDDAVEFVGIMSETARASALVINFALGDMWNQMKVRPRQFPDRCAVLMAVVGGNVFKYHQLHLKIRQYASVAGKWPAASRHADETWTYHTRHRPDKMNSTHTGYIKQPVTDFVARCEGDASLRANVHVDKDIVTTEVVDAATNEVRFRIYHNIKDILSPHYGLVALEDLKKRKTQE